MRLLCVFSRLICSTALTRFMFTVGFATTACPPEPPFVCLQYTNAFTGCADCAKLSTEAPPVGLARQSGAPPSVCKKSISLDDQNVSLVLTRLRKRFRLALAPRCSRRQSIASDRVCETNYRQLFDKTLPPIPLLAALTPRSVAAPARFSLPPKSAESRYC